METDWKKTLDMCGAMIKNSRANATQMQTTQEELDCLKREH